MEILKNTRIDFLRYRRWWIAFSCVVMALGVLGVFFLGKLNLGVEFTGGTQTRVRFAAAPDVERLRADLKAEGLAANLQSFGDAGERSVLIRVPARAGTEEGSAGLILAALRRSYPTERPLDLNLVDRATLVDHLADRDPDGAGGPREALEVHYEPMVEALWRLRKDRGLLSGWEELAALPEISAATLVYLRETAELGAYSILSQENIGPQMGSELRRKGVAAVAASLIGMLLYIWLRFELRYAIGAIMASLHDVLVTLGLLAFSGLQLDLSTIAALLTVVGYSVNDTVVVFDRVRENRRASPREPLESVINRSLNQTLSRTVLTSGTTLAATASLLAFGGEALRSFAFVMTVGVIVGTYSTIYIVGPFALLWSRRRRAGGGRHALSGLGEQRTEPAR